jgi:hypothetical protein
MSDPQTKSPPGLEDRSGQMINATPTLPDALARSSNSSEKVGPLRSIQDGPWCYQSKAALRTIREANDTTGNLTSALATYSALTEYASNKASDCFEVAQSYIGMMTGLHRNTVGKRLQELAALGLIQMHVPALKALATIRLLRFPSDAQPGCNVAQPRGSDAASFGNVAQVVKNERLGTIEEQIEEHTEESKEVRRKASAPTAKRSDSDQSTWVEELKASPAYDGIAVEKEFHKMLEWCRVNRKQATRRRFVAWLNRIEQPLTATARQPQYSDKW